MNPEMKITAIAPWFGGKRTLAPRIIAELGNHSAYWEPFCGSMAVLLAKEPSAMETANDLHGDLVNLARCVQDDAASVDLFARLVRTICAEPIHREAAERHRARGNLPFRGLDVERAADYFICAWLGRNGVAGTMSYNQGFCRRFTKNGGHAAKRFASAVESIPDWWDRLRHVTILNDDGFTLLPRIEDAAGVVIYLDPPYLEKGASYVHDFDSWDHYRLAAAVRRFTKTRVIVSYYEHPRLAELYPGWTKVSIDVSKAMASQGRRDAKNDIRATEVLLINGPSYMA